MSNAFFEEGTKVVATAGQPPQRDENHRLTLAGMKQVIDEGGSVKIEHNGGARLATKHEHLPSEADLAGDDERKKAAVRESLLSQMDAIEAELAKIGKGESRKSIAPEPPGENPEVARLRAALDKERADRQAAETKLGHAEADRQAADKAALDADKARHDAEKARREAEAKLADASKATPAPNVVPAPSPAPATNAPPKDKAK